MQYFAFLIINLIINFIALMVCALIEKQHVSVPRNSWTGSISGYDRLN